MKRSNLSQVLHNLHRLVDVQAARDLGDAELLERFRARREETAFAILLQRHGPMVLGVCRRVLGRAAEAEDAFQATFLVLVRKAATIRKQESLGSWLYGVAYRIAAKLRRRGSRQRAQDFAGAEAMSHDSPADQTTWDELRTALDEEIHQLPDKYRLPVVLCYLEGKTHEQAARELAWPKSSVSARLGRARQLLQQRLTRRGVALSASALATALAQGKSAAGVPALLMLATVRLALGASQAAASHAAAALADRFLEGMTVTKMTKTSLVLLTLVLAAGAGVLARQEGKPGGNTPPSVPAIGQAKVVEDQPAGTDVYGDPLPTGALARLGTVRLRHGDNVMAGVFSPDGKTLATAGIDSKVRLWDVATGKEKPPFPETRDSANSLAFTSDGKTLIGRGFNEMIVWDATGKVAPRYFPIHPCAFNNVAPLALASDDRTLATSGKDNSIRLWDLGTGKELLALEGHQDAIPGLAFSPNGKTLASASFDGSVRLWDLATGKERHSFRVPLGRGWSVAISPDGKTVACGGRPPCLWEIATGKLLHQWPVPGGECVGFTPQGEVVTGGTVWDPVTGKKERSLDEPVYFSVLSRDGKTLASLGNVSAVRLWDLTTGKERLPWGAPMHGPSALVFSPDSTSVVSGHWRERAFHVWDARTGKERHRWTGAPVKGSWGGLVGGSDHPGQDGPTALAYAPDRKTLFEATGVQKGTMRLWDTIKGQETVTFSTGKKSTQALAVSPDGRVLATADYETALCLWDAATGKLLRTLEGPSGQHKALTFAPDGQTLFAAGGTYEKNEYEVVALDLASGKARRFARTDGPVASLAFSPEGRYLAVGRYNKRAMVVLDVAAEKPVFELEHEPWLLSVGFSPDGKTLALGIDKKVRLVEVATGKDRALFQGHQGWVEGFAFSPDGNRLASGCRDTTILVWDLVGGPAPGAEELATLWANLAAEDTVQAYKAMGRLVAAGPAAGEFLQDHLRPVAEPTPEQGERIGKLIAQLDSEEFARREQARQELEKLKELAEPGLQKTLAEKPSPEVARSVEELLGKLHPTGSPARLQVWRALEVLERLGTPEARKVIDKLATGASAAALTRAAAETKARLDRR